MSSNYLSSPILIPLSEDGQSKRVFFHFSYSKFKYGVCGIQGWRRKMEDAHLCIPEFDGDIGLFGIFDGHGGQAVALFAKKHLPQLIKSSPSYSSKDYKNALIEAYLNMDKLLNSEAGRQEVANLNKINPTHKDVEEEKELVDVMGCTACVALITNSDIYVANIGDSRCILNTNGKILPLSEDHKPEDQKEKKRIEKAGSKVIKGRVDKVLNLSRAFGDYEFKLNPEKPLEEQAVSPKPDIKVTKLSQDTRFVVLACDGIWNCIDGPNVLKYFEKEMKNKENKSKNYSQIVENLLGKLISPSFKDKGAGFDNMTCILITLN